MILRPSAAHLWVKCAGQPRLAHLATDWADDEDTAVREEGTACHWSAHQHVTTGKRVPVDTVSPNGVAITEDMHDAHDMYFDAVRGWGVNSALFEQFVIAHRVHPQCQGTADVGAYDPAKGVIFVGDLKYGYRFVDVFDNWQLLCYAVGLQNLYGIQNDIGLTFEFLIVQPRSTHRDGPVRRWRVAAPDVRAQINILAMAADRALAERATCATNPGCPRCDGRHHCETFQSAALGVADTSYEAIPHALPFSAAESELRLLRRAADIIEGRITALEGQVTHGIKSGQSSKHFAIEESTARRVWNDEQARANIINIASLYGKTITTQKIITPTQADKLLPPSLVAANSHRPPGALKLIPIEQSRAVRAFKRNPL